MAADKVALITGANKGIGLETARQLGKMGMTVLIGSRDEGRGKSAADGLRRQEIDARPLRLDVADQKSVDAAAAWVGKEFGRLDVLVNNAGVNLDGWGAKVSEIKPSVFRETFETNVFGLIAVTQAMLPHLRKSAAGRIVNLSSILGSLAEHEDPKSPIYNGIFPAYDASKAALNMWTLELARELKDAGTKIKVNAAHPGWVKTDMGGENAQLELPEGAKTGVMLATLPEDGPTGGFYHMGVHMRW